MLFPLIQVTLNVKSIFSTLQKWESAVENVGVENLRDRSVDKPHRMVLIFDFLTVFLVSILAFLLFEELDIVFLKNHFNIDSDRENEQGHSKIGV